MQIRNRVIAISGYKGSGKDITADFLVRNYGYNKISLASPLKDMVARQYNLHRSLFDSRQLKDEPLLHLPVIPGDPYAEMVHNQLRDELNKGYWTPRALLILEGSTKRAVLANYWAGQVVQTIKNNPDKKYVIPDLRYRTEADILKMLLPREEIYLLRIDRPAVYPTTQEASERDLDLYKFDGTVYNISETEDVYIQTLTLYFEYLLGRKLVGGGT